MWRTFFINIIMCLLWIGEVTAQDDKSAITNSVDTAIVMDNIDFYGGYRKKVMLGTLQGKI